MSARPGLQGPGVLGRRYVRRAPGAPLEVVSATAPRVGALETNPGATRSGEQRTGSRGGWLSSARLVPLFVGLLIACQLALLVEAISPVRVVVRTLSFGLSLALLVLVPGRSLKHPALPFVLGALGITALNFFNPGTVSALGAMAQLAIQLSIVAPLLWVTRLSIDPKTFRLTLALLFFFNTASATVGVLQVYFPGRFQPNVSTMIQNQGEAYVRSLEFETVSGERVFRPMGLTDMPGGAATGAFYSVLLGGGFLLSSRRGWVRGMSVGSILVGLLCLYLCQVRALALMLVVCVAAMALVLALSGRLARLATLVVVVGGAAVFTFGWAVAVGGDAVFARWNSLFEERPEQVYHRNRGLFLEVTLNDLLPVYPLGAGLGRYGMANAYFGDNSDPARPSLWAEIQWTAWVYDGGFLVMVLYPLGLLAAMAWVFRIARQRETTGGEFWLWGSVIFAYNLGALALTFSYSFFMSQMGMEFWLLNAALFGAWTHATTLHAHRR
ncbi:hypothetical protein [Myxococcus sp. CA039A]|uniref:hypothetical protein n=1 Tax=Myxococcus sp. CA039A TaxID=2741737 RepID=UPI00157A6C44|nr:hypothetical protein [Myxococcus sp. CA039A]NTX58625.1 hypothetical protein [Myxococcus sp. CA039A]